MTTNDVADINNTSNLKICHLNCQSLRAHCSDLINLLEDGNWHIIGVTESWLKPHMSNDLVSFPGYQIYRNDRLGKGGGGVALYVREDFVVRILAASDGEFSGLPEFLVAEVHGNSFCKSLISVVYRAPNLKFPIDFWEIQAKLSPSYRHSIIMGDFNMNLNGTLPNGARKEENKHLRRAAARLHCTLQQHSPCW